MIEIIAGDLRFLARLEEERAPKTSARFRAMLPLNTKIIQARWSGEAGWVPFGELDLDLGYENQTSYPAPGHLLLYPGGISETEILFPYGATVFAVGSLPVFALIYASFQVSATLVGVLPSPEATTQKRSFGESPTFAATKNTPATRAGPSKTLSRNYRVKRIFSIQAGLFRNLWTKRTADSD